MMSDSPYIARARRARLARWIASASTSLPVLVMHSASCESMLMQSPPGRCASGSRSVRSHSANEPDSEWMSSAE
jgi:hypothetical protein